MLILSLILNFYIFLLGLVIGSFLNCVIYRLEKEQSFLKGRSYCPHCKHNLIWLDLIPVFSFLFLKGKCRYCGKKISIQYTIVEIITGLIFLFIYNEIINLPQLTISNFISFCFLFIVSSFLIIIFVYDLKHYMILDKVLFPAIAISLLYRLFIIFSIWNYLFAALIASGFFLFIFLISKGKWMGFGDVKLAILLGLLLGFPNILVGLFLAFFFGAIIGLALIFLNKKGLKSEIPFAPFLIIGTFIAMFFGSQIIQWYLNFFKP